LWLAAGLVLAVAFSGARAAEKSQRPTEGATTRFLIVGKSKIVDPPQQQQRAVDAVARISRAAKRFRPEAVVDALCEDVMTREQYRRGEAKEKVTGNIFRERLERLAKETGPNDTVIIYTHSHGRRNGFEDAQPLGGLVMDLPIRRPERRGTLLWDEYAELILDLPAKNVVVLTMACFSGGLVEYLESPTVKERWKDRRRKQGRNLIVVTSQNKDLISSPIVKDNELINPFTYAVERALLGEADGFELIDGQPVKNGRKDGAVTVGEFVDYLLRTTATTASEAPRRKNNARPQVTGSFDRNDAL
jgi:hypothetical protein